MHRNGKLFRAFETFVLVPLIVLYATTTLLSDVEGAQALPSPREIMEARKTVGQFLRTEAGEAWLAKLAKSNSAPLTTADLMKAILETTREGDRVWQAATLLIEPLKSEISVGTRLDTTMDQSDSWKDLIADIEMEDDIICLYRKSANETAKKADDWKKFLRTISPGYVVHLAIDTGRKYVICLKKIEIPEIEAQKNTTTTEGSSSTFATTEASAKVLRSEATNQSSTVEDGTSTSSATIPKTNPLKDETSSEQRDGDARCKDRSGSIQNYSHARDRDSSLDDADSLPSTIGLKTNGRTMDSDRSASTGEDSDVDNKKLDDDGHGFSRGFDRTRSYISGKTSKNLKPRAERDKDCQRPIIFVVPSRNDLATYQRVSTMKSPIYGNAVSNRPWASQNFHFPRRVIRPPANYVRTFSDLPAAMQPSDLRLPAFGYNDVYRLVGGYQPPISKNIHVRPKISRRRSEPFLMRTMRLIKPLRPVPLPTRSLQFSGANNVRGRFGNLFSNPRYGGANLLRPRFREVSTGGMKTSRGSGLDSSFFIPRASAPFDERRIQARNIVNPRPGNMDSFKKMLYDRFQRIDQSRNRYADASIRNPASYEAPIIRSRVALPSQSLVNSGLRPGVYREPRPGNYPIANAMLPLSREGFVGVDPRVIASLNWRQTVPCGFRDHKGNCKMRDETDRPYFISPAALSNSIVRSRAYPYQMGFVFSHHSSSNQFPSSINALERYNCMKCCCDRPIKLEILVNSKVPEPLKVGAKTEAEHEWELDGSADSAMSRGSTANRGTPEGGYELHDNVKDDVHSSDAQVEQDDKTSSFEIEPLDRNSFEIEKNDSAENKTDITAVGSTVVSNEGGDVEQRFFHETTAIQSNSSVATNTTTSTETSTSV